MHRRDLLAVTGALSGGMLAGCLGSQSPNGTPTETRWTPQPRRLGVPTMARPVLESYVLESAPHKRAGTLYALS